MVRKNFVVLLIWCFVFTLSTAVGYTEETQLDEVSALTDTIRKNPKNIDAYFKRGLVYLRKSQYEQAVSDYTRVIELNPEYTLAYYNRALAYLNMGKYDGSISDNSRAIELDSQQANAFNNRGYSYFMKGQYDIAIADYSKAIELNNNSSRFYNNRGFAYYKNKQYDTAIADYNRAIELEPNGAIFYYRRGLVYHDKAEYGRAIQDYTKTIEIAPKSDNAYYNRGNAYYITNEYDLAIADYKKVIEINPKADNAYYFLGKVYYKKGNFDQAQINYNAALKINPKDTRPYYGPEKTQTAKPQATGKYFGFIPADQPSHTLDNGLVIKFLNPLGSKKMSDGLVGRAIPNVWGVHISVQNTSNEVLAIRWAESAISVGSFSGLPFLGGMYYVDAGLPGALPDTIIAPGQNISMDVSISRVQEGFFGVWNTIGEVIPAEGLTVTLTLKLLDGNGKSTYRSLQSPLIGIE